MEINYLRELVVLAQMGNFLEAADALYIAQSTLSKHIKKIESELGVPLFDRTTRKVSISKYGQLFLPYAKQIAEIQDQYTIALQNSLAIDRERRLDHPSLTSPTLANNNLIIGKPNNKEKKC